MILKEIYGAELLLELSRKKKRIRAAFGLTAALFAVLLCLALAMLYPYTLLCTAVCLLILLSAYFILAVLLKIKLSRIDCYADFLRDLDEGLACEGIYTVKRINSDVKISEYGLDMRSVELIQGTEALTLYVEASTEPIFVPEEKYIIRAVGKYAAAVGKYEDR